LNQYREYRPSLTRKILPTMVPALLLRLNLLVFGTFAVCQLASCQEVEPYRAPITDEAGHYRWETLISFGVGGNSDPFRTRGWIVNKLNDVTWTHGNETGMAVHFPASDKPVILRAQVKLSLAPEEMGRQRVSIFVNSEKVGDWLVAKSSFREFTMIIPARLINPSGETSISFKLPDARSPRSLGTGRERRKTALAFKTIRFEQLPGPLPEIQQETAQ